MYNRYIPNGASYTRVVEEDAPPTQTVPPDAPPPEPDAEAPESAKPASTPAMSCSCSSSCSSFWRGTTWNWSSPWGCSCCWGWNNGRPAPCRPPVIPLPYAALCRPATQTP